MTAEHDNNDIVQRSPDGRYVRVRDACLRRGPPLRLQQATGIQLC